MTDCLFCKIIAGDIPAEKLYEDDKVLAFKDVNAQAPEHFLVIPKEHISTPNDANNAELMGELILTATKIAKERGFAESGYRLVMNCNAEGGQVVFHIHLHCLGGRKMTSPLG
jgi:histidine triad (HIT) family protein